MTFEQLKEKLKDKYKNNKLFVIEYVGIVCCRDKGVNDVLAFLLDTFYVANLRFYVNDVNNKVFITME